MGAFEIFELLGGIGGALILYVFVLAPLHSMLMSTVFGSSLVISILSSNVSDVIAWAVIGFPLMAVIGTVIYAYNQAVYRQTIGG